MDKAAELNHQILRFSEAVVEAEAALQNASKNLAARAEQFQARVKALGENAATAVDSSALTKGLQEHLVQLAANVQQAKDSLERHTQQSFASVSEATQNLRAAYQAAAADARTSGAAQQSAANATTSALAQARAELAKQDLQKGHAKTYAELATELTRATLAYRAAADAAEKLSAASSTDKNQVERAKQEAESTRVVVDVLRLKIQAAKEAESTDLAGNVAEAEEAYRAAAAAAQMLAEQSSEGSAESVQASEREANAAAAVASAKLDAAKAALRASADGTNAAKAEAAAAAAHVAATEASAAAAKKAAQQETELADKRSKVNASLRTNLLGEGIAKSWDTMSAAFKNAGDSTLGAGQRALSVASAFKSIGSMAVSAGTAAVSFAKGVLELALDVGKADAAIFKHNDQLVTLGMTYAAMQSVTAQSTDAQVAFALTFSLADRGMTATREQYETLARTIRGYANVHQVTQEQASAVVMKALDGDAASVHALGLRLEESSTTAQRHASILEQLARANITNATETQNATEAARAQEQASERAQNKLKSWVGGYYRMMFGVEYIEAAINRVSELEARHSRAGQAEMQLAEQRRRVTAATADLALRAAKEKEDQTQRDLRSQIRLGQVELERQNVVVANTGEARSAQEQYEQALTDVAESMRSLNDNDTASLQRRLKSQQALTAAVKTLNEENSRRDTLRNGQAELGLLAQSLRAHGLQVSSVITSVTHQQRYVQLKREAVELTQRETESQEQFQSRATNVLRTLQAEETHRRQQAREAEQQQRQRARESHERRQEAEEYEATMRRAEVLEVKRVNTERFRWETEIEWRRRVRAEQDALNEDRQSQIEADQQAEVDRAEAERRRAREKAEEVRLDVRRAQDERERDFESQRQRKQQQLEAMQTADREFANQDQPLHRLTESFGLAEERSRTATQAMAAGAKAAYDGFGELAAGIAGAVKQAADGGKDAGAAVAKYVDEWAGAKALQWGLQAAESLAGAGVAYFIRPDAVPGLLASAAMYAGLAAVAGITTAAIPNAPAEGGDGQTGTTTQALAESSRNSGNGGSNNEKQTIVFNISGIMANEQTQEALVRGLRDAQSRGLIDLRGL